MERSGMTKIIAALAAGCASSVTREWALRRGFEQWAVVLLAAVAGAVASAAVLRA